jgi:hypothetical protein
LLFCNPFKLKKGFEVLGFEFEASWTWGDLKLLGLKPELDLGGLKLLGFWGRRRWIRVMAQD